MKKHPQLRYVWPWAALLISALSHAQTTPPPCPPGQIANPPGVDPPCYTPLPPEWTPRIAFLVQSQPENGGSVPPRGYVPLLGELYNPAPLTWDLYQATVTYIGGVNPQTIYGTFNMIHGQMSYGDKWVAQLKAGPCFVMMRHQLPVPPSQATNVQGQAHNDDTSIGGAASSINGMQAACATAGGDGTVTIEVF